MSGPIVLGAAIGAYTQDPYENPFGSLVGAGIGAFVGAHINYKTKPLTFKHKAVTGLKYNLEQEKSLNPLRQALIDWTPDNEDMKKTYQKNTTVMMRHLSVDRNQYSGMTLSQIASETKDHNTLKALNIAMDNAKRGVTLTAQDLSAIPKTGSISQKLNSQGIILPSGQSQAERTEQLEKYFINQLAVDPDEAQRRAMAMAAGTHTMGAEIRGHVMSVDSRAGAKIQIPLTATLRNKQGEEIGRYHTSGGKTYAVTGVNLMGRDFGAGNIDLATFANGTMAPEAIMGDLVNTNMSATERLKATARIAQQSREYLPLETGDGWAMGPNGPYLDPDKAGPRMRMVSAQVNVGNVLAKRDDGSLALERLSSAQNKTGQSEMDQIVKMMAVYGENAYAGLPISSSDVVRNPLMPFDHTTIFGQAGRDVDVNIRDVVPYERIGGDSLISDSVHLTKTIVDHEEIIAKSNAATTEHVVSTLGTAGTATHDGGGLRIGDGAAIAAPNTRDKLKSYSYEILDFGSKDDAVFVDEEFGKYIKELSSGKQVTTDITPVKGVLGYTPTGQVVKIGDQYTHGIVEGAWIDGKSLKVKVRSEHLPGDNYKLYGAGTKVTASEMSSDDLYNNILRIHAAQVDPQYGFLPVENTNLIQTADDAGLSELFRLRKEYADPAELLEHQKDFLYRTLLSNHKAAGDIETTLMYSKRISGTDKARFNSLLSTYASDAADPAKFEENNKFIKGLIDTHYDTNRSIYELDVHVNTESGGAIHGAGKTAGISWNQQSVLMQKGITAEEIALLGTKNHTGLYELDLLAKSLRIESNDYQAQILGDKEADKFSSALSLEPENRIGALIDDGFKVDPNAAYLGYNLTDPKGKIKSVNLATVSTERSGYYKGDMVEIMKGLDSSKVNLIRADINYRKYKDAHPTVAQSYLDLRESALKEYEAHLSSALSGDNNLYKKAYTLESDMSSIMKARPMVVSDEKFEKMKGHVLMYEDSIPRFVAEGHETKIIDEVLHTKGLQEGDDKWRPLKVMIDRQPSFGSGSSYIADVGIIDRARNSSRSEHDIHIPVNRHMETWYGNFQYQDFDGDYLNVYSLGNMSAEQEAGFVKKMNSATSYLEEYKDLFDKLGTKGGGKDVETTFDVMERAKKKGISLEQEILEARLVDDIKARMRKPNAPAAATIGLGLASAVQRMSENATLDPKLKIGANMLAHAFIENIIKTKHLSKEDIEAGKGNEASEILAARTKWLKERSSSSKDAYRGQLRSGLESSLGGKIEDMADGPEKVRLKSQFSEILDTIINAEMTYRTQLNTEAQSPVDTPVTGKASNKAETLLENVSRGIEDSSLIEKTYSEDPDFKTSVKKTSQNLMDQAKGFYAENKKPLLWGLAGLGATAMMIGTSSVDPPVKSLPVVKDRGSLPPQQQQNGYIQKSTYGQGQNISIQARTMRSQDHGSSMSQAIFGTGVRSANLRVTEGN